MPPRVIRDAPQGNKGHPTPRVIKDTLKNTITVEPWLAKAPGNKKTINKEF
jgi:hypothetical protein